MNRWQALEDFYAPHRDAIENGPRDEWAIPPNAIFSILEMTPIELWLWGDIREANAVFYPQWPVAGCFLDFANPAAKVAIECDGAAFHQDKEKDATRDAKLEAIGWRVFRLTGKQCRRDCDDETGDPGIARQWIDAISDAYGLRRNAVGKSSFPVFQREGAHA